MKIGILKWISLVVLSGIVALGPTVRGAGKTETILTNTCFIYTDGLLDELSEPELNAFKAFREGKNEKREA